MLLVNCFFNNKKSLLSNISSTKQIKAYSFSQQNFISLDQTNYVAFLKICPLKAPRAVLSHHALNREHFQQFRFSLFAFYHTCIKSEIMKSLTQAAIIFRYIKSTFSVKSNSSEKSLLLCSLFIYLFVCFNKSLSLKSVRQLSGFINKSVSLRSLLQILFLFLKTVSLGESWLLGNTPDNQTLSLTWLMLFT